jgi:MYND finger
LHNKYGAFCLAGYAKVLQDHECIATQKDMDELSTLSHDTAQPLHHRLQALFTRGYLSWHRGSRDEAARLYRRGIALADSATDADRGIIALVTRVQGGALVQGMDTVAEDIDVLRERCVDNLSSLQRGGVSFLQNFREFMSSQPGQFASRTNTWPEPCTVETAAEIKRRQQRALTPVLDACAACAAPPAAGARLLKCNRCGLAAYCNKECQRAHWRAKHKEQCTPADDLHEGDFVRLTGDVAEGPLQQHRGDFFKVVGKDGDRAGSWLVCHDLLLKKPQAVPATCLQRVLVE